MAKNRSDKKPVVRDVPVPGKVPKTAGAPTGPATDHPIFCFRYVNKGDPRWAYVPGEAAAKELMDFMCSIASNNWQQVEAMKAQGRFKHHFQNVSSIDKDAQKDLTKAKLGERFGDEMFRFRTGGKKRLWGFRQGQVFHVIWWDPDHLVYPVEP